MYIETISRRKPILKSLISKLHTSRLFFLTALCTVISHHQSEDKDRMHPRRPKTMTHQIQNAWYLDWVVSWFLVHPRVPVPVQHAVFHTEALVLELVLVSCYRYSCSIILRVMM